MKYVVRLLCLSVAVAFFLGLTILGCARQPTPPPEGRELLEKLETGLATREAVELEFEKKEFSQLVEQLEADSLEGVEPFNSLAYREIVSRGSKVGEGLASSIKIPDRSSVLSLIALREIDNDRYHSFDPEVGTAILVDALGESEYFNTWGLPHLYWEAAAHAIIEYEVVAIEPLRKLLIDNRAAPVWGSEEVQESNKYGYRVKDYAWALLLDISGRELDIPRDPTERDSLISALERLSGPY